MVSLSKTVIMEVHLEQEYRKSIYNGHKDKL